MTEPSTPLVHYQHANDDGPACGGVGVAVGDAEPVTAITCIPCKEEIFRRAMAAFDSRVPERAPTMRRVILESPYAGDIERTVRYARAAMADCLARGEAPFASHLLYTQPGVLDDAVPEEREKGIAAGLAWRNAADATVVYTDLGISAGMRAGIGDATDRGQPVEYRTLHGWSVDGKRACLDCTGRGEVLHVYPRHGGPPGNQLVPCKSCDGTGRIPFP